MFSRLLITTLKYCSISEGILKQIIKQQSLISKFFWDEILLKRNKEAQKANTSEISLI